MKVLTMLLRYLFGLIRRALCVPFIIIGTLIVLVPWTLISTDVFKNLINKIKNKENGSTTDNTEQIADSEAGV